MLYLVLCDYQTADMTATIFSLYHLVHGVESVLPVECKIPSLKLAISILPGTSQLEEHLVHSEHLYEHCRDSVVALEINKSRVMAQYNKSVYHINLRKVNWSYCMTKLVNHLGQVS